MVPTRDHDVIRRWAATNDAVPALIHPIVFDGEPAVLHFLTGEARAGTPEVKPIGWDEFFALFDVMDLAFAFDETTPRFRIVRIEKSSAQSLAN